MSGQRDAHIAKVSQSVARTLGLPVGYGIYSPFPLGGLNQKDSRYAIDDKDFYWVENFIRLGNGFLRTVWDKNATPIYTATSPREIVSFFFYNIGPTDYCAVFLDDGSVIQVNVDTLAQTSISATVGNVFYDSTTGTLPACVQWGTQYLLISNNNTPNDYWIWDGTLLFATGTLGPIVTITGGGYNYSSAPTLTFYGGSPSVTPTATTTLDNGSIALVSLTNPGGGYSIEDLPQVAFSGGGTDTGAILTASLAPGIVKTIIVSNKGSGYGGGTTVSITGGGGTGATASAFVSSGKVQSITITAAGSGYVSAPTITIIGTGTGATAFAAISAGFVDSIAVTNGGTGYIYPPELTLIGGGGTDASAVAELTPTTISYIRVTNGGSNYAVRPNVTVQADGNPGSGAAATAVLSGGSVVAITLNNPGAGYTIPPWIDIDPPPAANLGTLATAEAVLVGVPIASVRMNDKGRNYTSPPAVVITPGANNSAYATVELMPFGVSGSGIETFQSRVWLTHPKAKSTSYPPQGGNMFVSEASSLTGFNPGAGGVLFTNTQSVLRKVYNGIKQSNGYLYPFGDSSVDVISNVQTTGDPATTTFNYQNTDPDTGTAFGNSVISFGRTLLFANKKGVFGLYGGAVTRLSEKLNDIFNTALFPPTANTLSPSSAKVHHHNVKLYLLLLTITDPFTNLPRNVMLSWDEKDWYVLTQTDSLKFIGTQTVESDLRAWATNGSTIFRMFTTPSTTLQKVIATKLYGMDKQFILKQVYNLTLHGKDMSSNAAGVSVSGSFNTERGTTALPHAANLGTPLIFSAPAGDVFGYFLGMTLGSTSKDFALYTASIGYVDYSGPLGSGPANAPAT